MASEQLELNQYYRIVAEGESDLVNALREMANNNCRRGYVEVSFENGDYTGGQDVTVPVIVSLVMIQSEE